MRKGAKAGIGIGLAALFVTMATMQSQEPQRELQDNSQLIESQTETQCDPSYPDFCLSPYGGDLDCNEIPYSDFTVYSPDRHGFDRDNDGIGCES